MTNVPEVIVGFFTMFFKERECLIIFFCIWNNFYSIFLPPEMITKPDKVFDYVELVLQDDVLVEQKRIPGENKVSID